MEHVPFALPPEQLGPWGLLIPNQLRGASGSPQSWAVCQGLLSTAELSSCVRVLPCCLPPGPGQPVWFGGGEGVEAP